MRFEETCANELDPRGESAGFLPSFGAIAVFCTAINRKLSRPYGKAAGQEL